MTQPDDDRIAAIVKNQYVLQIIIAGWNVLVWVMGVGAILGGLAVEFGPPNTRVSTTFRLMANLALPNNVLAWVMIAGGVMLLLRKTRAVGHVVLGICFGWWSFVVIYILVFLHEQSSLIAVTWALTLMGIHFVSVGARVAVWQFARRREAELGVKSE